MIDEKLWLFDGVRGRRSRLWRERRNCESKRKRGCGERVVGRRSVDGESRWSASKSDVSFVSIRRLKGKDNCDYYLESPRVEEVYSIRY